MKEKLLLDELLDAIKEEFLQATEKFDRFYSAHEGYAVIKEELDELWEEIKKKDRSDGQMYLEAKQVAAMGLRFMYDLAINT